MLKFSYYVDDILYWSQICDGSIKNPITQVIDPSRFNRQTLYICEEAEVVLKFYHGYDLPKRSKVVVKWEPMPAEKPATDEMELTGDYHKDCNMLMARIAELEEQLNEY